MYKAVREVLAIIMCVLTFLSPASCKDGATKTKDTMVVTDVADAIEQLQSASNDYGYDNALSELTEISTSTIDGDTYYRLQQNYKGIPVYGRNVICATRDDGTVTSITGNALDVYADIDLVPSISVEQAISSVGTYMMEDLGYDEFYPEIESLESDSLCVFIVDGNYEPRLAYRLNIADLEIVMDANTADILSYSQTVYEEAATGYAASDVDRSQGFSVEQLGEYYYIMSDESRGLSVYTFAGRISKEKDLFYRERASILESTDDVFGNNEAEIALEYEKGVQLLLNTSAIHDCFLSLGFSPAATDTILYYNDGYDNGENALGGRIADGRGIISMGSTTGVNCIDIIAHEYTHVVSRELVDWIGKAENGALNEAMSDIFGEILESFVTGDDIDWQNKFRNIADPSARNNPDFYMGDNWGDTSNPNLDNDNGYEHRNSTVISHAAYLMWNGIDGSDSKKIGIDDLAELWYRTMKMMPPDCDFGDCRELVNLAASSMKLTKKQISCVGEAFDTVGVHSRGKEDYAVNYELASDGTLCVYDSEGKLYDDYTLTISSNTAIYSPVIERVDNSYNRTRVITSAEPYSIDIPVGNYIFTISDNANPSVSYSFTVRISEESDVRNIEYYALFGGVSLRGTVSAIVDVEGVAKNIPITNATVTIYSGSLEDVYQTFDMSETEGCFEVFLPFGAYSIDIEADGYCSETVCFESAENAEEQLDIVLEVENSQKPMSVIIYDQGEPTDKYEFAYNALGQVESVSAFSYDSANGFVDWFVDEYEYDDYGNIVSMNHMTDGVTLQSFYYEYIYDSDGRITEYSDSEYYKDVLSPESDRYILTYDDRGYILGRQNESGSSIQEFTCDEFGNVISMSEELSWADMYFYDTETYDYTYSPFVIDFYTSQSEGAGNYYEERTSVSFRPVWNLNIPLIDIENSYSFEVDDLGNLQSITDADGNILCACYYEEGAVNIVPNETYEDPATEPTEKSYIDCYKEILKEEESSGADASYIIYDINKDGIPEMIIRENSYYFYVYTFSDYAAVFCGEFIGEYPNGLYAYDGNGLVVNTGGSGTMHLEDILLYSLENGSLLQGEAIAYESSPEYVAECLAAYTNISYFTSVSDYSLLENN